MIELYTVIIRHDRLLQATPTNEDPTSLLQSASQAHMPVNPLESNKLLSSKSRYGSVVPEPEDRPPVDDIITELEQQVWYSDQIVERRTFEAKDGQRGEKI